MEVATDPNANRVYLYEVDEVDPKEMTMSDLFWMFIDEYKDLATHSMQMGAKRMRVYRLDEIERQAQMLAGNFGVAPRKDGDER